MIESTVWEPSELEIIGLRVNGVMLALYMAVDDLELTREDLEKFRRYISKQEAAMPIIDPSFYRNAGSKQLDDAARRLELLNKVLDVREKEARR